jgi:Flp pilus assembly pilin Flp
MMNTFKSFLGNESGAVTVDWVVLTAAIVGLGLAVITSVRSGVTALGSDISTSLTSASVVSLGTLGSN